MLKGNHTTVLMDCYICKVKRERESNDENNDVVIIECHKCNSLFHEQCLHWWLDKATRCPHCKESETAKFVYHIN